MKRGCYHRQNAGNILVFYYKTEDNIYKMQKRTWIYMVK